jgi:hypothetical protein
VLVYQNGQVKELISQLSYPTGLELSADDSFLLIGEGTFSRVWR